MYNAVGRKIWIINKLLCAKYSLVGHINVYATDLTRLRQTLGGVGLDHLHNGSVGSSQENRTQSNWVRTF